jgi:TPR repeat protein
LNLHDVRWLRTGMLILFAASTGWSQQAKLKEILVVAVKESDQNPAEAERQYKSALHEMETGSFEIERSIVFGLLTNLYCAQERYAEAADSLERSTVTSYMLGRTGRLNVLESKSAELGLLTEREKAVFAQARKGDESFLNVSIITCLNQLASRNAKAAQFLVGSMYEFGSGGIKQDLDAAIRSYRSSSEQGFVLAQIRLGDVYFGGKGVAKDYVEARKWYEKASTQLQPYAQSYAQSQLGWLYDNGLGVQQDYDRAYKLYRVAAEQGDPSAQVRLGWLLMQGLGVRKDPVEGVSWYQKAALQGNREGQNNLGTAYLKGVGVKQDDFEAATWYRRAAEQGLADGQYNLGHVYHQKQDYKEAIRLYEMSVEQGNKDAMVDLGWMCEHGEGANKNIIKATALYFLASERGDEGARMRMNNMLRNMSSSEAQEVRQWIDAWKAKHKNL